MSFIRNEVNTKCFNRSDKLPFGLRLKDFEMAMQDVYDFFYDVNLGLIERGLQRLDDMLRPAIMSGVLSDMLTASLAKHSRSLTVNLYHNGHPDLVVNGVYPDNKAKAGMEGVEMKLPAASCGVSCEILRSHYPPLPRLRRVPLAFIPVASYGVFGEGESRQLGRLEVL